MNEQVAKRAVVGEMQRENQRPSIPYLDERLTLRTHDSDGFGARTPVFRARIKRTVVGHGGPPGMRKARPENGLGEGRTARETNGLTPSRILRDEEQELQGCKALFSASRSRIAAAFPVPRGPTSTASTASAIRIRISIRFIERVTVDTRLHSKMLGRRLHKPPRPPVLSLPAIIPIGDGLVHPTAPVQMPTERPTARYA